MLWDLIRDFFVEHVFGGTTSLGYDFNPTVASGTGVTDYEYNVAKIGPMNINIGDWLSTTATIISITIIVVLCCLFVYKIIKLIGGLIR